MTINSIKEFLENRKKVLLEELLLISSNFEEMNLNNGNFDYPFFDSFDEIVASLSIKNDYEDIKEIHSIIIQRLEEASKTEEIVQVLQNDEEDLEAVLKLEKKKKEFAVNVNFDIDYIIERVSEETKGIRKEK